MKPTTPAVLCAAGALLTSCTCAKCEDGAPCEVYAKLSDVPTYDWPPGLQDGVLAAENYFPGLWHVTGECGPEPIDGTLDFGAPEYDDIDVVTGQCGYAAETTIAVEVRDVAGFERDGTAGMAIDVGEEPRLELNAIWDDDLAFTLVWHPTAFAGEGGLPDGRECRFALTRTDK